MLKGVNEKWTRIKSVFIIIYPKIFHSEECRWSLVGCYVNDNAGEFVIDPIKAKNEKNITI